MMRRLLILVALFFALAGTSRAQSHSAILTWTASTTPNVTYTVLRSTDGGATFPVLKSGIAALTYTDTAVTAGAMYQYEVESVVSDGTVSAPTTPTVATIPGGTGGQPSPLSFATIRLAPGTVGTPYTSSVSAAGGTPPYSYASQTLPPGLLIASSTGAITGTPQAAGSFAQTFTVTDSSAPPLTASAGTTLTINPAVATTCKPSYVVAGTSSVKVGSITWSSDAGFSGGTDYATSFSIKGTTTTYPASLYNRERWGVMQLVLPAQAGCKYTLTLGEDESTFTKTGRRVFSVTVGGAAWLNNLDLIASTGGIHVGKTYTTTITASGTSIVVGFVKGSADMPKVDFISLVPSN